jgi:hypothetical protein
MHLPLNERRTAMATGAIAEESAALDLFIFAIPL